MVKKRIKKKYLLLKFRRELREKSKKIQNCLEINRNKKRFKRIKGLEDTFNSIRWTNEAKNVMFIANFTNPPWQKIVKLDFCHLRNIYIKYLKNIEPGEYKIKFIVDGKYCCFDKLPMIKDPQGNFNNIVEMLPKRKNSIFRKNKSIPENLSKLGDQLQITSRRKYYSNEPIQDEEMERTKGKKVIRAAGRNIEEKKRKTEEKRKSKKEKREQGNPLRKKDLRKKSVQEEEEERKTLPQEAIFQNTESEVVNPKNSHSLSVSS